MSTDTRGSISDEVWHAPDCGGGCDGCGYIAADGLWYAGPCPSDQVQYQRERAEG